MNPQILNWLQETLNRLFIKQPRYFKYWTWLSYLVLAICGLPYVLVQFHIHLPEPFATLSNKAATWAAGAALLMSKLVVKTPVVGKTEEGQAVQVTSEKQMPFTAKSEAKEIAQAKPPIEKIPEVPAPPADNAGNEK